MDNVAVARVSMGTSLAFHIVFAVLGVGFPVLISIAEGLAIRRGDAAWMALARRWSKAFGILFVVGAVSGTTLSFELGLLFPRFMALSGSIIGLPFTAEGFAFFLEAIFLGLYLYGWERLSPFRHWLCSIPIAVSGGLSALFVVAVNSWMNTPAGFEARNGVVVRVDPLAAVLNPSTPTEDTHMLFSAYVVTGFVVAAVYAGGMLRGRSGDLSRRAVPLAMGIGLAMIALSGLTGDLSARFVADAQPIKFAAQEGLFQTQRGAPLTIGGIPLPGEHRTAGAIEIPYGLSLLKDLDPFSEVKGLDAFPADVQPPVAVVHLSFDVMTGLGLGLGLLGLVYWFLAWRRRRFPEDRWLLWAILAGGPASVAVMETGWFVTEFGRQPWIVYGVLRTAASATPAPGLLPTFVVFIVIYIGLAVVSARLLLLLGDRNRAAGSGEGTPAGSPRPAAG
jgi:cytochrome d ubiquinol oxidase subunit I